MSKGGNSQSQEAQRSELWHPQESFEQNFKVSLKTVCGQRKGRTWGKQGITVMVQGRKEGASEMGTQGQSTWQARGQGQLPWLFDVRWLMHSFGNISSPGPHTEAAQHRGNFPDNESPADADISMLTSHLEAVTLEGRDLEAAEDSP